MEKPSDVLAGRSEPLLWQRGTVRSREERPGCQLLFGARSTSLYLPWKMVISEFPPAEKVSILRQNEGNVNQLS